MDQQEPPLVSAVFLVVFDQKVGYSIAWKRSKPDINLDGVEYQCLPSGLHSVRTDLVYFIHEQNAGISVFQQEESDAEHRNASFVAVGALVPLSYGRLGRSWLHAEALRQMASDVAKDTQNTDALEQFWEQHRQKDETHAANRNKRSSTSLSSIASGSKRKRARSDATLLKEDGAMSSDTPALSLPSVLDLFGPLLFPLYRAALLRKRVLLLGHVPVQPSCNTVYNLSVLSNVPRSSSDVVPTDSQTLLKAHALFNIGVYDMDRVATHDRTAGWLACTTDDILAEKKDFYDVLVEMPSASARSGSRRWPRLREPGGKIIKATQRDLRRYRSLRREIRRQKLASKNAGMQYEDLDAVDDAGSDSEAPLIRSVAALGDVASDDTADPTDSDMIEPNSWAALAYHSVMWWASSGEQESWEADEALTDVELLKHLPSIEEALSRSNHVGFTEAQTVATMLVAYFHRITHLTLSTLADIVEDADDETEEGIEEDVIQINADSMRRMGLDVWSENDRHFIIEAVKVWFSREATIVDDELRMCGMRIC